MLQRKTFFPALVLMAIWTFSFPISAEEDDARSQLSSNIRISSAALGYDLHYRVYVPSGISSGELRPALYVTDGQWYIASGRLHDLAEQMNTDGSILSPVIVFVDSRNPDNRRENRRNQQFFCKQDYADFFRHDLIPKIEADYPVQSGREARTVLGLSFGGLNAACFGLIATDVFGGIAMQSPANHPVPSLNDAYEELDVQPVKMFLSVGTKNDNTRAGRLFKKILQKKGYDLTYKEVPYGHNWRNWKPLLDDVLMTFYQAES